MEKLERNEPIPTFETFLSQQDPTIPGSPNIYSEQSGLWSCKEKDCSRTIARKNGSYDQEFFERILKVARQYLAHDAKEIFKNHKDFLEVVDECKNHSSSKNDGDSFTCTGAAAVKLRDKISKIFDGAPFPNLKLSDEDRYYDGFDFARREKGFLANPRTYSDPMHKYILNGRYSVVGFDLPKVVFYNYPIHSDFNYSAFIPFGRIMCNEKLCTVNAKTTGDVNKKMYKFTTSIVIGQNLQTFYGIGETIKEARQSLLELCNSRRLNLIQKKYCSLKIREVSWSENRRSSPLSQDL
jgi:hypothetical protein